MGREVRKVPANWAHPTDANGGYLPLFGHSFSKSLKNWKEESEKWEYGFQRDYINGGWKPLESYNENTPYEEYAGSCPSREEYMPEWSEEECTHFQMYETTTQGTPISPVMESPEGLAMWLVENKASAFAGQTASYEEWLHICKGGYAPSAIATL